jgi:hypothetical protein
LYSCTCVGIRLLYIWLLRSSINTLLPMQCRETFCVFKNDLWVQKSGQLCHRVIEQICRQEVTNKMEAGPKLHKKKKNNIVLKFRTYYYKLSKSSKYYRRPTRWDFIAWVLVKQLQLSEYFLNRHYLTIKPDCQTVATFNVQLYTSEGFNTLNVKCSRRRVWETLHSGAIG